MFGVECDRSPPLHANTDSKIIPDQDYPDFSVEIRTIVVRILNEYHQRLTAGYFLESSETRKSRVIFDFRMHHVLR